MDEDVPQLTRAMASGQAEAFARFYEEHFDRMYAEARRLTDRDEDFCLDVVQDAMVKAIRSIRPIRSRPELGRWVKLLVRSVAYDRLRRESRRRRREARRAAEWPPRAYPGEQQETAARLAWIREQILAMDAPSARLLTLRYRLGWTLKRIGRVVGLKPGAVDGRVRRLVEKLKEQAREQFDVE